MITFRDKFAFTCLYRKDGQLLRARAWSRREAINKALYDLYGYRTVKLTRSIEPEIFVPVHRIA